MTAKTIAWILATNYHSPFYARKHTAVVPNVSWSLLPWEADLLICTKAGYLTEIEIKISMCDWKADFLKAKHRIAYREIEMVKSFYYAAPRNLAIRHQEIQAPGHAGVIAINDDQTVEVIKSAQVRPGHRKLTDIEINKLLRLGSIKAWRLAHGTDKAEAS